MGQIKNIKLHIVTDIKKSNQEMEAIEFGFKKLSGRTDAIMDGVTMVTRRQQQTTVDMNRLLDNLTKMREEVGVLIEKQNGVTDEYKRVDKIISDNQPTVEKPPVVHSSSEKPPVVHSSGENPPVVHSSGGRGSSSANVTTSGDVDRELNVDISGEDFDVVVDAKSVNGLLKEVEKDEDEEMRRLEKEAEKIRQRRVEEQKKEEELMRRVEEQKKEEEFIRRVEEEEKQRKLEEDKEQRKLEEEESKQKDDLEKLRKEEEELLRLEQEVLRKEEELLRKEEEELLRKEEEEMLRKEEEEL